MISIVFPVFNEEKRLKNSLDNILRYFSKQKYSFEIIIVNDGSTDGTTKILNGFLRNKNLRVIGYENNLGKGEAVKRGVMEARGDLILMSDIDLSVPISTLKNFILETDKGACIVIGSRRKKGSEILVHQSFLRETMGQIFTKLSNLFLGTDHSDFTCGFKLFTKEAAKKIFSKQKIGDWAFDSETLFLAKKMEFTVCEVGVKWSNVRGSKVRFPRDIVLSLLGLLKIRWYDLTGSYN